MRKHFGFLIVAMLLATIGFAQNMLNEGFEGETFPPTYWTQQNVSGNSFARRQTITIMVVLLHLLIIIVTLIQKLG